MQIRNAVIGMNQRNIELIAGYNAKSDYKFADDKYLAKQILESNDVACPRTYAIIETIGEIDQVWQTVKEWNQVVVKPARGSGGKGIMILKRKGDQWYEGKKPIGEAHIFQHLANVIFGIYSFGDTDVALIEEYVRPHEFFAEIYPAGVPDFRVILLNRIPLMAMLRVPTARSNGKANLHQGGLGIGIDIDHGLLRNAYDGKKHLTHHPDSSSLILGKEIPHWDELMSLSVKTSMHFPLNFLGVDLVLDQHKGPMVMEVNARPGLGIQLANQEGLKEAIVKRAPQLTNLFRNNQITA